MERTISIRTAVAFNAVSAVAVGLFLLIAPGTAADLVSIDPSRWLRLAGLAVLCIGAALAALAARWPFED